MPLEFRLPQVDLNMESGVRVLAVRVRPGDHVEADQVILEVETQKANVEVPAPVAGYIRTLDVAEGQIIPEKALICIITDSLTEPLDAAATGSVREASSGSPQTAVPARPASAVPGNGAERSGDGAGVVAVPAARKLARELNIDLNSLKGTGPNGRIKLEDVQRAATESAGRSVPATDAPGWQALPPARLGLIRQMQTSLATIPQFHVARQMDVSRWMIREEGITFTHKLIQATGQVLADFPALRTQLAENRIRILPVAVAVAMDAPDGLIAPALRQPDQLSIQEVADGLRSLRERAANRGLTRADLSDAPFAISNLGMLGVDLFQAFVFAGQTAVLAVGRAMPTPDGRHLAWFNLAADHRVVDGAEAARFLGALEQVCAAWPVPGQAARANGPSK